MDIVSTNSIRHGVKSILSSYFPDIPVRDEVVEQGLNAPYFFIELALVTQTQELKHRYRRTHSFDIHFFAEGNENRAMHDMAEQLYDVMELMGIDSVQYRGTNMSHKIIDGVLHFYVDYTFIVWRNMSGDPVMQTMKQEGHVND